MDVEDEPDAEVGGDEDNDLGEVEDIEEVEVEDRDRDKEVAGEDEEDNRDENRDRDRDDIEVEVEAEVDSAREEVLSVFALSRGGQVVIMISSKGVAVLRTERMLSSSPVVNNDCWPLEIMRVGPGT